MGCENEINNLQFESVKIQSEAAKVARENVLNLKNEVVNEINKLELRKLLKQMDYIILKMQYLKF